MKYRLSAGQAAQLIALLEPWLVPDVYPDYDICSLYFDGPRWDLFRKSLDKPVYKEKLRLRSYGVPASAASPVFLEIKKKYNGIVYKRRMDCSLEQARAFLDNPLTHMEDITAREIAWMLQQGDLQPRLFVSYHRQAWTWSDDPDLRITIDDNLRWRNDQLDLADGNTGELLLAEDDRILEIKSTTNFPIVLVRTLQALGIRPASVSKAGLAYQKCLERGISYGTA